MSRFRRRKFRLLVLFAAFALLMQGMVALACDLHDAGHAVEAALHGHAIDDHDTHPEQDDDPWHGLFHAGHHCHHVPAALPSAALHLLDPPSPVVVTASDTGPPDGPSGCLFRPPISA